MDWTWLLPYFWFQEFIQQQTFKLMNKQKIYLTQQIHSIHLKNLFRKNVMRLLARVPFSLGSICKYWIYVIDDIGLFTVLLLTIFEKRSIVAVWQGSEYASGWYIEIWQIKQMCVIMETKCFYSFNSNSKSNQNQNSFAHYFWEIH